MTAATPEPPVAPPLPREAILAEARACVVGSRDQTYGPPEDSFAAVAQIWDALDRARGARPRAAADVALALAALKLVRASSNPAHRDSWVDLAGYAACGGGIAAGASHD